MQRVSKLFKALPSIRSTASRTAVAPTLLARPLSTTAVKMSTAKGAQPLLDLIKERRTYYPLSKELAISKDRIQEIVKHAVLHVPTSFNAQSNKVVVLFGAEHDKFWNIATEILKSIVPEDKWEHTAQRMGWFQGAAGTILFFEDVSIVEGFQNNIPIYADRFPVWSTQSNAMLQHTLWVALEAEGLGANLQHYNPLVDEKVAAEWNLPTTWKLNAQLVFGGKTAEAAEKTFNPIEDRYKVFGA